MRENDKRGIIETLFDLFRRHPMLYFVFPEVSFIPLYIAVWRIHTAKHTLNTVSSQDQFRDYLEEKAIKFLDELPRHKQRGIILWREKGPGKLCFF